jgi:hypothetical protein
MSLILAPVSDALLDRCSFHFMQLLFHLLAKCPDVNLLLGILRAVSTCHVAECVQRLIIHVNIKRLWKMSVVVWISEIFICQEISHFLSIFGCVFGQGSILGVGVDKEGSI